MSSIEKLSDSSVLPKSEQELIKSRKEVADLKDKVEKLEAKDRDKVRVEGTDRLVDKETEKELRELYTEVSNLRRENELFRRALLEIEAEKQTIAYNQLGSSIKIKILLQDPTTAMAV